MSEEKVKITPRTYLSLINELKAIMHQVLHIQDRLRSLGIVDRRGSTGALSEALINLRDCRNLLYDELAKLLLKEFLEKAKK